MRQRIKRNYYVAKTIIDKETELDAKEHFLTFLGSFAGIAIIGLLNTRYLSASDNLFLIGSFGATSVLIYGATQSSLAQPRNVIGGHLISAIIGVAIHKAIPTQLWLSASLSVSISIVLMQITKTLHPPGGATALIANIGSPQIQSLGFYYVLNPVLSGVVILLGIAFILNKVTCERRYPTNKDWFKIWKRKYDLPYKTRKLLVKRPKD